MEWRLFDPTDRTTYPPLGKVVEIDFKGLIGVRAALEERHGSNVQERLDSDLVFHLKGKLPDSDIPLDVCSDGYADFDGVRAWRPIPED